MEKFKVPDNFPLENGGGDDMFFIEHQSAFPEEGTKPAVAREFHGKYTIAEVETLLTDMRRLQMAIDTDDSFGFTPDNDAVIALAVAFSEELLRELGPSAMRIIIQTNQEHNNHSDACCASGDFCDSNMVMHAAFINVHKREPRNYGLDQNLWNTAWTTAKTRDFNPEAIRRAFD